MGTYTQAERDKLPASAFCGPSRTFYVTDADDVESTARLIGKADQGDRAAIRACVIGKARANGWSIPDAWKDDAEHSDGAACPSGVPGAAFSGTALSTDDDTVLRRGKIFEAGRWSDKSFDLSPEEMWLAVETFTPCSVDLEHVDSVLSNKLGTLERVEQSPDGAVLYGDVRLPKWLDDLLGDDERKVSCTWDRETKTLTGLALVRSPRIADAAIYAAYAAFAGARHSAGDTADMQQIHDIAARQGAACPDPTADDAAEGDPMATNDDLNAQIGLFGKFMRWMGNEQPQEAPAATAAFIAPPTVLTPAAESRPDPEKEALRQQLAQLQAQQIADRAAAFADARIAEHKALPAQRDAIVAAYTIAATDDAQQGQATFGNGKIGRVDALAALWTNAPGHTLTRELVPVTAGTFTAGNLMETKPAGEPVAAMSADRLAHLLAMTPQGKVALRDIVAKK